jgi:DNA-binding transcriptional regulator YiaG
MKVKEIRQKVMLTQKEFANVLNISLAVVQNWEQGKNEPSLRYKRKLVEFCKANGIEV